MLQHLSAFRRYSVAVLLVVFTTAIRYGLEPFAGDHHRVSPFYIPVIITIWCSGFGPSVVAIALSSLSMAFFFYAPKNSIWITGTNDIINVIMFMIISSIIVALSESYKNAQRILNREIGERKEAEQALLDNKRRKEEFLAMLAHELRNPLSPIANALSVMSLGDDPDTIKWGREVIERQTKHLVKLVDDLLDVSRITQGKINLNVTPLSIEAIIEEALETCRPLLLASEHNIEVSITDAIVDGDATRLTQIVVNLLNNAIKYTPPGGLIRVTTSVGVPMTSSSLQEMCWISIKDNGEGITADLLPKVFDLFLQADRAPDRSKGGLGVGLTLVRKLVQMHGGSVSVYSKGAGLGSEFVVSLPVSKATPKQEDKVVMTNTDPTRILLVEDRKDLADVFARLLMVLGHEVKVVYDGREACAAALEYQPHLVFLDIGLPDMDGYEVVKNMRAQSELQQVYIVACTGYGTDTDKAQSLESGFDEHLVKPVELSSVTEIVKRAREAYSFDKTTAVSYH